MFRLFGTTIGGESGSGKDGDGGGAKPTTTAATQRPRPGLDASGTRRSATANNTGAGGDKGGFFKLEPARGARGETTQCVMPLGVSSDTKPLGLARYICTTTTVVLKYDSMIVLKVLLEAWVLVRWERFGKWNRVSLRIACQELLPASARHFCVRVLLQLSTRQNAAPCSAVPKLVSNQVNNIWFYRNTIQQHSSTKYQASSMKRVPPRTNAV